MLYVDEIRVVKLKEHLLARLVDHSSDKRDSSGIHCDSQRGNMSIRQHFSHFILTDGKTSDGNFFV